MNLKNTFYLSIAMLVTVSGGAAVATAQDSSPSDKSVAQIASDQSHAEQACFDSGDPIVDSMPKRPASKREQQIIDKILRVVTRGYGSQQAGFSDLDGDHNCKLDKSEVSQLLKKSKVSGLVRLIATGRLMDRYDVSDDGYVQWREFHFAIDKAIKKQAKKQAEKQHASELLALKATKPSS